jgi:phosphoglycerate dehydrogenase-like enzyme
MENKMGRVKPLCLIDAVIVLGVEPTNQIDVFEMQPPPLPNSLFDLPNVILSPHVAYVSKESSFEMDSQWVEDMIRHFQERDR